jgi:hypothetical protein
VARGHLLIARTDASAESVALRRLTKKSSSATGC